MNPNPTNRKPQVFISHKHVDSQIADVIRSFIRSQSGGRVAVFQSSSPWADSPQVGRNLNKQLKDVLWKTNVVILIYTNPDQDWNYCMWEVGVASHPPAPETKIILFQCTKSAPTLFADQVNVNVHNLVDIQKFVDEFLTSPDFFPEFSGPITEFTPHGQEVASAAADLSQKLLPLLPPEKEDPSTEWPAYPFLQLELCFDALDRICNADDDQRAAIAQTIILEESVVSSSDKFCEQLFGFPSFERGTKLKRLTNKWKEKYPNSKSRWVESLCNQVRAGVMWEFPTSEWELMQGFNDSAWRAPVLNRVRKIPTQKCMQFDIYFYKFDVDPQTKSLNVVIPA
jgi:hypothetical protein